MVKSLLSSVEKRILISIMICQLNKCKRKTNLRWWRQRSGTSLFKYWTVYHTRSWQPFCALLNLNVETIQEECTLHVACQRSLHIIKALMHSPTPTQGSALFSGLFDWLPADADREYWWVTSGLPQAHWILGQLPTSLGGLWSHSASCLTAWHVYLCVQSWPVIQFFLMSLFTFYPKFVLEYTNKTKQISNCVFSLPSDCFFLFVLGVVMQLLSCQPPLQTILTTLFYNTWNTLLAQSLCVCILKWICTGLTDMKCTLHCFNSRSAEEWSGSGRKKKNHFLETSFYRSVNPISSTVGNSNLQ